MEVEVKVRALKTLSCGSGSAASRGLAEGTISRAFGGGAFETVCEESFMNSSRFLEVC